MALLVLAVGAPAMLLAMIVALVYALLGPRQAIQALAAMVVLKYLNSAVYSFPPLFGMLAWLVLLFVAIRALPMLRARSMFVLGPLWLFVLIAAGLAAFSSSNPTVSLMKLASFTVGTTGVIAAAMALQAKEAHFLRAWLPTVVLAVAAVSLLTVPFPAISQRVYSGSFQGIFNHPQSFGTFLAPLVTLLVVRFLLRRRDWHWPDSAALVFTGIILLSTGTRTAAIAVLVGVLGSMFLGVFHKRTGRKEALRGWLIATGIGAVALTVVLAHGGLRSAASDFIFKRDQDASLDEAFMASRGAGIESQWSNFLSQPLTGHGFGVFPGGYASSKIVTFMGLPISAPVEKGFLPTAVLEEVGVVGALLFLVLIGGLVRQAYLTGDQVWTAVLLTCLFVNLGEAVFFSVGGIGLIFWLWMGLAIRGTSPLPGERVYEDSVGSKRRNALIRAGKAVRTAGTSASALRRGGQ